MRSQPQPFAGSLPSGSKLSLPAARAEGSRAALLLAGFGGPQPATQSLSGGPEGGGQRGVVTMAPGTPLPAAAPPAPAPCQARASGTRLPLADPLVGIDLPSQVGDTRHYPL